MTTIIARPGLLVADTQTTGENGCEYRSKVFTLKGHELLEQGLWSAAGDTAIRTVLRSLITPDVTLDQLALGLRSNACGLDATVLWVTNNYVYELDTDGLCQKHTEWITIGSGAKYANAYLSQEDWANNGGHFALAAMAMRAAVHLDPYTGGKIEERIVK